MIKQNKPHPYRAAAGDPAPAVPGTVRAGDATDSPPPPLTLALIRQGQAGYRAFCAPCHSELGDGHGMVVQRGFPAPPPFTAEPAARLFDIITNGQGTMYSFAQRIPPDDRWAIVAYVRALQRSGSATLAALTPEQRATLTGDGGAPR